MKVCIVGTAPGSRLIAPYNDPTWDIWVCSAGNSQASAVPRVTKWYELHALCDMMAEENQPWCIPYFAWLRAQSFPIYMQENNEYIPQAIVFPYKPLVEEFGPNPKKGLANWFTSSVAWMMAHALVQMKEGDELGIFGVDMAATEEHYSSQKAGCLRFIEIARSRGVKVTIPYESCLGKTFPLYGYAEATPMGRKLQTRRHEIEKILGGHNSQIRSLELQRAFFEGAQEAVNYDIRTWGDGMDAELDDGSKEQGEAVAMVDALKNSAAYVGKDVTLTTDYAENGQGVFVPKSMAADMPAQQPAETIQTDGNGKKHYGMRAEPGVFSSSSANDPPPKMKRAKPVNGLAAEG